MMRFIWIASGSYRRATRLDIGIVDRGSHKHMKTQRSGSKAHHMGEFQKPWFEGMIRYMCPMGPMLESYTLWDVLKTIRPNQGLLVSTGSFILGWLIGHMGRVPAHPNTSKYWP